MKDPIAHTNRNFFGPSDLLISKQHPDIASRDTPTKETYALASSLCSLDIEAISITAAVGIF